jgi:hypothetical protein
MTFADVRRCLFYGYSTIARSAAQVFDFMALPREARISKHVKHLPRSLGKSPRIVLQGVSALSPKLIVQRDDGMWSIGWHDNAAGPSETREFAAKLNAASARRVV